MLLDNTKFWIENNTYEWKELAARFHHKLVQIHIFPNGNGRHARLITEILLFTHGQAISSWGIHDVTDTIDVEGGIRYKFMEALREADSERFEKLITFTFY